jgi:hypothetical protein
MTQSAKSHSDRVPSSWAKLESELLFTIECAKSDIECLPPVKVPGGTRMRILYTGGSVSPARPESLGDVWRVASGSDWILDRTDGVLVFDGRLTIENSVQAHQIDRTLVAAETNNLSLPRPQDFLFSLRIAGVAKLGEKPQIDVALPVQIEGPTNPPPPWAAARLRDLSGRFERYYDRFVLHQCLALGQVTRSKNASISAVHLDVYKLVPK